MCGAGKVEPHGPLRLHATIQAANKVLFPEKIPAGICQCGKFPRKIAPIAFCGDSGLRPRPGVTVLLHFSFQASLFADAASHIEEIGLDGNMFTFICLAERLTPS